MRTLRAMFRIESSTAILSYFVVVQVRTISMRYFFLFPLLAFFVGCVPMHVPNMVQAPLFENSGEVHLTAYAGTNSYDGQLSYAPVQRIALLGAGSWSFRGTDTIQYHTHRYGEAALGYFFPAFELNGQKMKIEAFVGYGQGNARGTVTEGFNILGGVDAVYRQYYVQLNSGISEVTKNTLAQPGGKPVRDNIMEYGSVFRISDTKFSSFQKNGISLIQPNQESYFLQTTAFARIGIRGFMLEVQGGGMLPIFEAADRPSYFIFYLAIGVHLVLGG